ncbi:MAG: carbamoyltransferase HypF [Butyrivibrio sp.]|nr:carbamoyltransferase HypF [Butyrivibrio sp.]
MVVSIKVKGAVQGVGYRPFIANKATEYGIAGYVKNIGAAVEIIASGNEDKVRSFLDSLYSDYPSGAIILDVESNTIPDLSINYNDFRIIDSESISLSDELPVFLPDIGICDDCLKELLDSNDRRFKYPLISCASCGPRLSIIEKFPYDRATTKMKKFVMCPRCHEEYLGGRRKHAQTISCHDCGPQMVFDHYIGDDILSVSGNEAVERAIAVLLNDGIIGLKGISGYQFVCKIDAVSAKRLRSIKGRENKPFAVMFADINSVKEYCLVNEKEEELLRSFARPIVLLNKIKDMPYEVCKDSRYIGAFLPSSGIHKLLCDACGPIICTSGNLSDDNIIIDDEVFKEAFLKKIDGMLFHDREIVMPQDDSVCFVLDIGNSEYSVQYVRRARGYAPLPLLIKSGKNGINSFLAIGGDLKSTFSLAKKDKIIPSQYIGDLESTNTYRSYKNIMEQYLKLFEFTPDHIICDLHPMYYSTRYAKELSDEKSLDISYVQHHFAHSLSVMAEHLLLSCIGISFDGTGYGTDGKVWGGEILHCSGGGFSRKCHLKYVMLSGGNSAPKNAELVKKCYEKALNYDIDDKLVEAALSNKVNVFETSSMGRLFDAVSALLDIKNYNSYEGECAILLENMAEASNKEIYPSFEFKLSKDEDGTYIADQLDLFDQVKRAYETKSNTVPDIAYGFHMAIASFVKEICCIIRRETSEDKVCLSGGVFNNRILLRECIKILRDNDFKVYWNNQVPCGDSGIATGQAYYGLICNELERR